MLYSWYLMFISFDKLHHCIVQASYQVDTEARLAASASMQCRSCWKILSCATRWATCEMCEMCENTEVNTKWKNDETCELVEVLNFAIFWSLVLAQLNFGGMAESVSCVQLGSMDLPKYIASPKVEQFEKVPDPGGLLWSAELNC
jgi:hypothetical protein